MWCFPTGAVCREEKACSTEQFCARREPCCLAVVFTPNSLELKIGKLALKECLVAQESQPQQENGEELLSRPKSKRNREGRCQNRIPASLGVLSLATGEPFQ